MNALKEVKQPGVDLIADFGKIFDVSNKFNSELLFCAHYQKDERKVYMSEVIAERVEFIANCNRPETIIIPEDDDELPFR